MAPTPNEYRSRYEALKAEGQKAPLGRFVPTPADIPLSSVIYRESVPPGWYWNSKVSSDP